LAISSVTNCSAKLSWVAAAGAASYEVRYRITGGVYSSPVNVGAVTNYTFTGLSATTSYDFQVRSVCAGGAEKSAYVKKTTTTSACGAPTSMTASGITSNSATISWVNSCDAVSYNLQYRKVPQKAWTTVVVVPTSKTITGLLANTTYEYKVSTNCIGGGVSPYLPLQTFTTLLRTGNEVIVDAASLEVNPNPAADNVSITIAAQATVNVTITNMVGQMVYNMQNVQVNGAETIDLSLEGYESGLYLVNIQGNNINVTKELVVSK
ncbi:MAG TPA: fibronectin type III domain-containing protein, partial [Chitinophagales bacterium]|nr:fibronectin type III domain-containing protein [Chitinophagales bacterium]